MSPAIYIAGPMTGWPDNNYAAFLAARADLEAAGWVVESPTDGGQIDGWEWVDYIHRGLDQLRRCTDIFMLSHWRLSNGAQIEMLAAQVLGLSVHYQHDGVPKPDLPVEGS